MVLATSRAENAARLARLPGVVAPRTVLLDRAALAHRRIEQRLESLGFSFPLLLRSPGFHTGRHFVRVDTPADLADAVQGLPGPELLVIAFIDARRGDGLLRKYRVMTIDGEIYPLHLAVSRDWKAHRATTGVDTPAAQAEEARFLDAMPVAIGERAVAALRAVQAALGLDYGGIDFTLSANGAVVVFEANAVMNILPPDPGPQWRCRHAASERALSAAQSMLRERVARSQAHANER
jgi:glutathione synthase/RimK-type ligase-like ATP-grasp enzyme